MTRASIAARLAASAWVVGLALSMTGLNAVKPLHMDDAVYFDYARHLTERPGDPYGGEVIAYGRTPSPRMTVLVPVFLPYLWSRAMLVHGEDAIGLAKLWLLPINLLLVGSTWKLARRFARGFEATITAMVATSPAILPSLNFMLDVPSLALGLASLSVFIEASDRGSIVGTVGSGLLAGLAINTKWTGLLVPPTLMLYALTHRRIGLGLAACLVSAGVFGAWEGWIALRYGESHFVFHSKLRGGTSVNRFDTVRALLGIMGGVAQAILLLGLLARHRFLAATILGGWTVLGFALVAIGIAPQLVFLPTGVLLLVNLVRVASSLICRGRRSVRSLAGRDSLFLTVWIGAEVLGFFVLSPYSAVRRVEGLVVVSTLLTGRLASRTCRSGRGRSAVRMVAFAGSILGLAYFGVDLREAWIERTAAENATDQALSRIEPGQTAFFIGRWGFRHYATRLGLIPVAPGRTELRPGDLLVVPVNKIWKEPVAQIDPQDVNELVVDSYGDMIPIRTVPAYYYGKEPLQHLDGPRFVVRIYRVIRPFVVRAWKVSPPGSAG